MEIEKRIHKYKDDSYIENYHKKGDEKYYHREDGPAFISYRKDGSIESEEYRINNKLHREDGPAMICYREDGSIEVEIYCVNDKCHREDGPTFIRYNEDGSIGVEEYCINNKKLSKEEWYSDYGWKSKLKGTPMGEIY